MQAGNDEQIIMNGLTSESLGVKMISKISSLSIYLQPTFATIAIIFLMLTQLEDISSIDVTMISAFSMLILAFSGSSSFTGSLDWLWLNHVFCEDQRKTGPLNHLCILLKFLDPSRQYTSSTGLLCWYILSLLNSSEKLQVSENCTQLATKTQYLWASLLIR